MRRLLDLRDTLDGLCTSGSAIVLCTLPCTARGNRLRMPPRLGECGARFRLRTQPPRHLSRTPLLVAPGGPSCIYGTYFVLSAAFDPRPSRSPVWVLASTLLTLLRASKFVFAAVSEDYRLSGTQGALFYRPQSLLIEFRPRRQYTI